MAEFLLPDFKFDKQNFETETARLLSIIKPSWSTEKISLDKITGGNSNITFRCYENKNKDDSLTVRVHDWLQDTQSHWLAVTGKKAMQEMSQLGHFPKIRAIFANGMCYDYAVGEQVFDPKSRIGDITDEVLKAIAEETAFIHSLQVPDADYKEARYFEKIRKSIEKGKLQITTDPILTKEILLKELDIVENYLKTLKSPIGLCHFDLHPGNMIWNDDKKLLTIFDWDGASIDHQLRDIAQFLVCIAGFNSSVAPEIKLTLINNAEEKFLKWYFEAASLDTKEPIFTFEEYILNVQGYKLAMSLVFLTMYMFFTDKYGFLGKGHTFFDHSTSLYLNLKETCLGSAHFG